MEKKLRKGPGRLTRLGRSREQCQEGRRVLRPYKPSRRQARVPVLLVDVVLLPMKGGVGLDNDVLVRGLLEFVDEHGLAGLQGFGDFRIHANGEIWTFVIGSRHLARFGLDFIAQRGDGLDHTGAGAIRARLAEDALESLLGALAGDADEAEFV